ncbi:MAG: hypothetical protein D6780_05875 [Candidatus Dadabacteria bacterium]|nr:MAG: hypothetical protein D6780_05875 [Candidatus Dadabacteria bacterium]
MDNGEVIPGLDEPWTFVGANAMEWVTGIAAAMIVSELFLESAAKNMPLLLLTWLATTFGMAGLRKKFPDQQKGIANAFCVKLGIEPPGIPTPAELQPVWSGAPLRELDEEKEFVTLELEKIFPKKEEEEL